MQAGNIFIAERAYCFGRGTDDQAVVGKFLAFCHQCTGADQAIFADFRAVQNDRLDPDQRAFRDRAAVQHRLMADCDVFAYHERVAGIGVQHAAFLDIAVFADRDAFIVAANRHAKPDAGIGLDVGLADDIGGFRHVSRRIDEGNMFAELVDSHKLPIVLEG